MQDVFTVKIDRKNLYARKYENKIYKGEINQTIRIKNSFVEVFAKMINNKNKISIK